MPSVTISGVKRGVTYMVTVTMGPVSVNKDGTENTALSVSWIL